MPAHFRFAVKVPKEITHLRRLADADEPLERFLAEAGALGEKLGPLLLQLPPSFAFDGQRVSAFLRRLRGRTQGRRGLRAAAPELVLGRGGAVALRVPDRAGGRRSGPGAGRGGARRVAGLAYYRLHGSPRMYYSPYALGRLDALEHRLSGSGTAWCIFDNTAEGWATHDALLLWQALELAPRDPQVAPEVPE